MGLSKQSKLNQIRKSSIALPLATASAIALGIRPWPVQVLSWPSSTYLNFGGRGARDALLLPSLLVTPTEPTNSLGSIPAFFSISLNSASLRSRSILTSFDFASADSRSAKTSSNFSFASSNCSNGNSRKAARRLRILKRIFRNSLIKPQVFRAVAIKVIIADWLSHANI